MQNLEAFKILTVCTGNVCRSPVAERLLQKGLDDLYPGKFAVSSAGTSALVGQEMQPSSAEIVQAYGGDATSFVAKQISVSTIRDADLILVLTMQHRAAVLQQVPAMLKRTFTIREFGRMLGHLSSYDAEKSPEDVVGFWREVPARANAVRHATLAVTDGDNDVIDPFGRPHEVYRQMEDELIPALNAIVGYAQR